MTAKEWLESKSFAAAGKVNTKDALIALELAELEAVRSVYVEQNMTYHVVVQDNHIALFKQKHNIQ